MLHAQAHDASTLPTRLTSCLTLAARQAHEEGAKFSKAHVAAKGDNKSIPAPSTWKLSPDSKCVVGWKGMHGGGATSDHEACTMKPGMHDISQQEYNRE